MTMIIRYVMIVCAFVVIVHSYTIDDHDFHTIASFSNMCHSQKLEFNGDAVKFDDIVFITQGPRRKRGSVFLAQPVPVRDGFQVEFTFRVSHISGHSDGDGFAFVVQSLSPHEMGSDQSGIGYSEMYDAFVVEFDTFENEVNDGGPTPHVQIHVPSKPRTQVHALTGGHGRHVSILDHQNHSVVITYVASPGYVHVSLDGRLIVETRVRLHDHVMLMDHTNAFLGFTASTGGAYEAHQILSWSVAIQGRSFGCLDGFYNKCEAGWSTMREHKEVCNHYKTCTLCTEQRNCCVWCDSKCVPAHVDSDNSCSSKQTVSCSSVYVPNIAVMLALVAGVSVLFTLSVVMCTRCGCCKRKQQVHRRDDDVDDTEQERLIGVAY